MGRIGILVVMLLVVLGVHAQGQQPEPGIKRWSLNTPLQWIDFTGKPDSPESIYAAATYAGLALDVVDVNLSGRVTFKVNAVFDSKRSWAHPDRSDDYVLAHEQLHFDIAEMYARRLQRKLNALQLKVKDKEVAKRLLLQYNQAQMKEQERYDKECVHGLNQEQQLGWRTKVDRELRIKRPAAATAVTKK
jgi:hypothetical protein